MVVRLTVLLLLLAVGSLELAAQTPPTGDSLDYYPYHAGDFWGLQHTWIADFPPFVYVVDRDSTDSLGNRFLFISRPPHKTATGHMMIDTAGDVYADVGTDSVQLLYRTRAKVGDWWQVFQTPTRTVYATCSAIHPDSLLGRWPTTAKEFQYWSTSGGGDSVWEATRVLARGFGEFYQRYDSTDFDSFYSSVYLSGVRINGRMYGYILAVDDRNMWSSLHVAPNPFIEGATMIYHLDTRQYVRLTISDPLGRVVAIPVDEVQSAGEQTVHIDGTGLPEGTYFYRLQTDSHTASGAVVRGSSF